MTRRAPIHAATWAKRPTASRMFRRAIRALMIAPLLTATVNARLVHEPQEPINLMPALRLVMSGAATPSASPPAAPPASSPVDAGRPALIPSSSAPGAGLSDSRSDRRTSIERHNWRDSVRLQSLADPSGEADRRASRTSVTGVQTVFGDTLRGRALAPSTCPGAAVPLMDRLSPERTGVILRNIGQARASRSGNSLKSRAAPKPRARSPLASIRRSDDPAIQRVGSGVSPTVDELEGAGHMEVHWTAEELGLSTFIGGSQAEESAHATAFGRDIGAELGVQFMDDESHAFRFMVARSFKNDLDVPVQDAKLRFEVNVRF